MNSIRQYYDDVLWCGVTHWHPEIFDNATAIASKISQDLLDSGIDQSVFDRSRLLLSFLDEGHGANELESLCQYFDQSHSRDRYLILASPYIGPSQYPIVGFTKSMVNHGNFFTNIQQHPPEQDLQIDKKFLCLIRRAAPTRAEFASKVRYHVPEQDLRMSFGSHHVAQEISQFQHLFPNVDLPILLDGQVGNHNREKIYDVESVWYQSLFNIVVETSSQTDPGIWRSVFITEKTFKAFAMCQIPVWFAVPGLVEQVKALGFDVFSDIVDHSYDSIQDQPNRMDTVVNRIMYLHQKYSLKQCQELRFSLWHRLQANYNLLATLEQEHSADLRAAINKFIFHEN